jgi:ribonuclease BN (tRNA processing enzyme)
MKVTFLGTGAPLAPERATLGLLLEAPGCDPLLLDSCGGFELMRRLGGVVAPAALRDVILSHRHGDHIGGVMALALAVSPLHLHGHPDTLHAAESLLAITYPKLAELGERERHGHPVTAGRSYRIAGFEVTCFEVEHRVPTLALRVRHGEQVLAYSADSLPCAALEEAAADADLFICDALCAHSDRPDAARALMHPTALEAAQLGERAGAKRLALVHLARYADARAMLAEAQANFGGEVLLPDDGDVVEVGRPRRRP